MNGDAGPATDERTRDDFLGGRLSIIQPRAGHRSGIEAVLIAAAAPIGPGETVLDIGSGVGVAGLCALVRVADTRAILVEADAGIAAIARENAEINGFSATAERARAEVREIDVTKRGAAETSMLLNAADHALANPPFHDPAANRISPSKSAAHAATGEALDAWLRFAVAALRPGGSLTFVHRADALGSVLEAFANRFGAVAVLPIHPRSGRPASRIIVQGRKGSRAPLSILPGLVLHDDEGHGFRPDVERVLRHGERLAIAD